MAYNMIWTADVEKNGKINKTKLTFFPRSTSHSIVEQD